MLTVVSLIVVLGVLVFVHEAGHFVAAKWAGIYVHRFSLGLGAPIPWLTFRRGETEYSISWLPLGGYVKMASREEDIGSSPLEGGRPEAAVPPNRMFEAKPVWQRMVVILAGVTMNALFAWLLFTFLAVKNGRQIDPVTTVGRVVDELVPAGAESFRQIRPGSRIVKVNGKPVTSWDEITQGIANTPDPEVRLELADGEVVTAPIHPDALELRLKASQALQPFRTPVVGQVVPGRPAARAGVEAGDTIVRVNGQPVAQWYDLLELLQKNGQRTLTVEVARAAGHRQFEITPYVDSVTGPDGRRQAIGRIGVAVGGGFRSESLSLGQAAVEGWHGTVGASTQIVRTVRGLFSGRISRREVGGPILIGQLAGESARLGLDAFLAFMALISINLAVLNLLPVPVLDGGQFMFLLAEAVVRRPLPLKLRERLTMVGLVLIVLLMGLAFSNDLRR
ncbi:MAG TPA: RIP metalloprotease RseP, partial [Gemmatimonadales bacterium]|nr:RIP metalloprotease RseP [Gemmatimonadales bacterium]